jgi:hypothetical protein
MKQKNNTPYAVWGFLWVIVYMLSLVTLVVFFSCNPIKKVNKNEDAQLAVIKDYQLKNPVKNDTSYDYKKGFTRVDTVVDRHIDTAFLPGTTIDRIVYRNVYHTRTDTVQLKILDKSGEKALQKILFEQEAAIKLYELRIAEKDKLIRQANRQSQKHLFMFWGLIALIVAFLVFKIVK